MPHSQLRILVWLCCLSHAWSVGVMAQNEVQMDAAGETTTTVPSSGYPSEVVRLADSFPKGVLTNDLALRVAAKIEDLKKDDFFLEVFALEDGLEDSQFLSTIKDPTELQLLRFLGQIKIAMEDTDAKYGGKDAAAVLEILTREGTLDDYTMEEKASIDDYRKHPLKFVDHTLRFLLYEFIAVAEAAGYLEIDTIQHAAPVFLPYR